MFSPSLGKLKLTPQIVSLRGGLDLVTASMFATPGTVSFARNYEALPLGGYERVGGIERFSGQPRPSDAGYVILAPAVAFTGAVVGDAINGQTSGATGVLIAITAAGAYIVTKVVGSFSNGENIRKVAVVLGVYSWPDPTITSVDDNTYSALAAANYRADIAAVPGTGPIRGVAILNDVVYAWRNNAPQSALVCFKSTAAGWVLVPLYREISFTLGGPGQYLDGSTLTQGTVSATIQRVVLESGNWASSNAAGRFIIGTPTGGAGVFAAGASTGGGAATLGGADTAIVMLPGGRVESDVYNFTGSATASFTRLYCCDGVNREFEFDGTTMVPIKTGMNTVRASFVKCHKFALIYAYQGSIQFSGPGTPYVWSPILGAGELGTGDTLTGFVPVGGSEAASALMVFGKTSTWVLYGNSASDFKLSRLSEKAGANAYSCQDLGFPLVHDAPGLRRYSPTKDYGNFSYELASISIEPLVKGLVPRCSVVARSKSRYRCFFTDGTCVVGTPLFSGTNAYGQPIYAVKWMSIDLSRNILVAVEGKIAGISRVFYGDDLGFVYEADVGRSFDGDVISSAIRMQILHQNTTLEIKQYRRFDIEATASSAFTLGCGFEFNDGDPDVATNTIVTIVGIKNAGQALVWDGSNWDQAYWGVGEVARKRVSCTGQGYGIAPILSASSAVELPHKLMAVAVLYSTLRYAR